MVRRTESSTLVKDSSNRVSQWSDKSGNGNHAIQSTTDNQPLHTVNGVQFDGSNDGFNLSNDISQPNLNVFMVYRVLGMPLQIMEPTVLFLNSTKIYIESHSAPQCRYQYLLSLDVTVNESAQNQVLQN